MRCFHIILSASCVFTLLGSPSYAGTSPSRADNGGYENPRFYLTEYTATAPSLITDMTNASYAQRKFQGIPSAVRTGTRYWAAWTGDIQGRERTGNFIVLAYRDQSARSWTEYGYIAYAGDMTKGLTASSLWQAPDGALWIGMTSTGNSKFFDGIEGTWMYVLRNPEANPKQFKWQSPFRLSRTGSGGKITPINDQFWVSQDYWGHPGVSKPMYQSRLGKRIHRVYPNDRRATYLFTLPDDIGGRAFDETMFAQAKDKSILAIYRTAEGLESVRSYDGGKSWVEQGSMVKAIGDSPSSRAWLGVSPSGRMVLVYNNAKSRTNLTLRLSDDGGRNWPHSVVLTTALASYPWVMFGPSDEIMTVYDNGRSNPGLRRIDCATVNEADVVAGTAKPIITIISSKGAVK